MILVVGGAYQGKLVYVKEELNFSGSIVNAYHLRIRELLQQGDNPYEDIDLMRKQWQQEDMVIICDEVGAGVVPMDAFEREYRETVGRICCQLAKEADCVYRVMAGVGVKIK